MEPIRRRPSSRLLVLDPHDRVLLFRFEHNHGPLAGQSYWATPGGGVEGGESFADAARRELFEETGIVVDTVGGDVARREFVLRLVDGEYVTADERFFVVRVADRALSRDRWTSSEVEVMTDYRWWSLEELRSTSERVFPQTLADILSGRAETVE